MPKIPQKTEKGLLNQVSQKNISLPQRVSGSGAMTNQKGPSLDFAPAYQAQAALKGAGDAMTNLAISFVEQKEQADANAKDQKYLETVNEIRAGQETLQPHQWEDYEQNKWKEFETWKSDYDSDNGVGEVARNSFDQNYSKNRTVFQGQNLVKRIRATKQVNQQKTLQLHEEQLKAGETENAKRTIGQALNSGIFNFVEANSLYIKTAEADLNRRVTGSVLTAMSKGDTEALEGLIDMVKDGHDLFKVKYESVDENGKVTQKTLKHREDQKNMIAGDIENKIQGLKNEHYTQYNGFISDIRKGKSAIEIAKDIESSSMPEYLKESAKKELAFKGVKDDNYGMQVGNDLLRQGAWQQGAKNTWYTRMNQLKRSGVSDFVIQTLENKRTKMQLDAKGDFESMKAKTYEYVDRLQNAYTNRATFGELNRIANEASQDKGVSMAVVDSTLKGITSRIKNVLDQDKKVSAVMTSIKDIQEGMANNGIFGVKYMSKDKEIEILESIASIKDAQTRSYLKQAFLENYTLQLSKGKTFTPQGEDLTNEQINSLNRAIPIIASTEKLKDIETVNRLPNAIRAFETDYILQLKNPKNKDISPDEISASVLNSLGYDLRQFDESNRIRIRRPVNNSFIDRISSEPTGTPHFIPLGYPPGVPNFIPLGY